MKKRRVTAFAVFTASALVLVGCSGSPTPTPTDDTRIQIVASTNVYGSLAAQIGGDRVNVTSIITNIAQDPHSYEASARDRLSVQNADLLIENGGGYDHFMEQLREGLTVPVITAVEYSNHLPDIGVEFEHDHNHGTEGFNEHVWYELSTVHYVAQVITARLAAIDPEGAELQYYEASVALVNELGALARAVETYRKEFSGIGVFMTEPLPGYLVEDFGLEDRTPGGFTEAVEEGVDIPPALLLEAITELSSGRVKVLLSNAQTGGAATDRLEAEARAGGIPIVTFTELLPESKTYVEWMQETIDNLVAALRQ